MVVLVKDENGVFDVLLHEVHPEIGLDFGSLLVPFVWEFNRSGYPGERNAVFTWHFFRWVLQGGPATRLVVLLLPLGGQGYFCQI